jgi:hypothetical protein
MICTEAQIENIIKTNPNKGLIDIGKDMANRLMLQVHGHGLESALKQNEYFESADIFSERKKGAMSNKDLFGRLLQREKMVFTAKGGSSFYEGLTKPDTQQLDATLDTIRFGMPLRKWIQSFALQAYRCDPMSVIFMEAKDDTCYPTYKCINSIFDYLPNGRRLEYICFKLTVGEAIAFGVEDELLKDLKSGDQSNYYRFVDDAYDYVKKYENSLLTEALPPIKNDWQKVPAIVTSDIIAFDNVHKFLSPLNLVTELAESFLHDRSVRDLQKKYHGFLKAIEPLLMCSACEGTGLQNGHSCPDCTPMGSDRGLGHKLRTKVADVARFPLSVLTEGFDFKRIFGYVGPDIEVWDKQDNSLVDIEGFIQDVYWGTEKSKKTSGPNIKDSSVEETATKTLSNLQPIYARLNDTADWAEKTESIITDFVGQFKFPGKFKKAAVSYGRFYILETPNELMSEYLDMKNKGASQFALFDTLKKYYHSVYQTNPTQLAIKLKLINVEPFVHYKLSEVQSMNPAPIDFLKKLYFSEWLAEQHDDYLLATNEKGLIISLTSYATLKQAEIPKVEEKVIN